MFLGQTSPNPQTTETVSRPNLHVLTSMFASEVKNRSRGSFGYTTRPDRGAGVSALEAVLGRRCGGVRAIANLCAWNPSAGTESGNLARTDVDTGVEWRLSSLVPGVEPGVSWPLLGTLEPRASLREKSGGEERRQVSPVMVVGNAR